MARRGGLSRRRRGRPLNAEVNIINLVDVMLVLLVIFMVTAPIMQGGIVVRLPKAATKPMALPDALVITVDRSGNIQMAGQSESWDQFRINFPVRVGTQQPKSVVVRGDARANYGDVVRVFALVKQAGIEKVGLMTELP